MGSQGAQRTVADRWLFFANERLPLRTVGRYLETEKRVPLQIENFGTLIIQVSFVKNDGDRMKLP